MGRVKVFVVICQLSLSMIFFQNCSEVEFTASNEDQLLDTMDLANEYPYKGETINLENKNLIDHLAQNQLEECSLESGDALSKVEATKNCRVSICHVPAGSDLNAHTLRVSVMAIETHIEDDGLDYLGSCNDEDLAKDSEVLNDSEIVSYNDSI
jgi:hypothetical protein